MRWLCTSLLICCSSVFAARATGNVAPNPADWVFWLETPGHWRCTAALLPGHRLLTAAHCRPHPRQTTLAYNNNRSYPARQIWANHQHDQAIWHIEAPPHLLHQGFSLAVDTRQWRYILQQLNWRIQLAGFEKQHQRRANTCRIMRLGSNGQVEHRCTTVAPQHDFNQAQQVLSPQLPIPLMP
jgi:V8-like Glu-specific endopeptidase